MKFNSNHCFLYKDNFNISLNITDNYTGTVFHGRKPQTTNLAMVNLNAGYKKFNFNAGYTNQYNYASQYNSTMNQGNFDLGYNTPVGNIQASYTIGKSKNSMQMGNGISTTNRKWTNAFKLTFTTTWEQLKNLKNKKKTN